MQNNRTNDSRRDDRWCRENLESDRAGAFSANLKTPDQFAVPSQSRVGLILCRVCRGLHLCLVDQPPNAACRLVQKRAARCPAVKSPNAEWDQEISACPLCGGLPPSAMGFESGFALRLFRC